MAYSMDPISDSCYPGTGILINKFDIRDEARLAELETVIVTSRTAEWEDRPSAVSFDFEHYKAVHAYLFSDLYEWAGHIRTVDISKKGTRFCPAAEIEERAGLIFGRLKRLHFFRKLPRDDFVRETVDFYCATNDLHPFREGNGRTHRAFLTQLIKAAGYEIDFSSVDGDLLMFATIQAAGGVTDLLHQIFDDAIHD